MKPKFLPRARMPRRAFLSAAGGLGISLPFLESLPERSAWAQDEDPVFSLYLCTTCGVVPDRFYPAASDTLTRDSLLAQPDQAMSVLADYAERTLLVRGVRYPMTATSCSHAAAFSMALTGVEPTGSGSTATSGGPSLDNVVVEKLGLGIDSLALYAGNKSAYISERLSFRAAAEVRAAESNPYQVYKDLMRDGGFDSEPGDAGALVDYVTLRRQSVIDLVREELGILMAHQRLGQLDKNRLQLHLETLRDLEVNAAEMMPAMPAACSATQLSEADFSAAEEAHAKSDMTETMAVLQMRLAAFAFACNLNRVATLQWGSGTDQTLYKVPGNERSWSFHHISHRIQSDAAVSDDVDAEQAHIEIDRVRLESFRKGLDAFDAHGILDRSVVFWTNQHSDGPSHSFGNLPMILVGNAGGHLKTGAIVEVTANNDAVLNTLMSVAGVKEADFIGSGEMLTELLV